MENILKIAEKLGAENVQLFGNDIAKVDDSVGGKDGRLVLVSAMTSNKSGIGKTTVSIGLADALCLLGKSVCLALREPSLGPVFGIKGGATGGGKSRVEPSDQINLHFTGDFHAVTSANNLLASIIDNHIFQGNALEIDTQKILFKRCLDLNERSLRNISYDINGEKVQTGFVITAASEIMAICCLAKNLADLKERIGNILVAFNKKGEAVFARDLHAQDAVVMLLLQTMKPNLVQTLCGTPALVHFGPFANIAHGCNSIVATKYALSHADYCVTEAGFGSDLGAEKFLDIKCRLMKKSPSAVVLVVVLDVIKEHGNGDLKEGFKNVEKHIENFREHFKLPLVVAINKHKTDSEKDIEAVISWCKKLGAQVTVSEGFEKGAEGCIELAKIVLKLCQKKSKLNFTYDLNESIENKIEKIATKIYGAKGVQYSPLAKEKLALAKKLGCEKFFVNIAKTQFSFSDDKNLLGAPKDFVLTVSDIEIRTGAGMIVPIAGNMLLMPGLGKKSNYIGMKVSDSGEISGLF